MKHYVKRIRCPSCQKLVRCHEQKVNDTTNAVCARCGRVIWTRDGIRWRYVTESV